MTAIDIVRFEQRLLRSSAGLGDAYEADTCIVCASFCVNRPDFSRDSMTGFWPAAAFRRSPFSANSSHRLPTRSEATQVALISSLPPLISNSATLSDIKGLSNISASDIS
ncbi:hypothetical protein, partial [Stutzerimonas frequens]|uniref:hypothetical protein n=1 Tax=Stutzerimonas frequens TaxID=2968969 RepID=UPI003C2D5B15